MPSAPSVAMTPLPDTVVMSLQQSPADPSFWLKNVFYAGPGRKVFFYPTVAIFFHQ
jgi:hypothetical protein